MPQYMIEYYQNLQKYFAAVRTIKDQAKEAFDIINNLEKLSKEKDPILIRIDDFSEDDAHAVFGLRRVCRLTNTYVFYLFKLYLEHRGRQPFQTINLVRADEVTLPVISNNAKTDHFCTVRRVENPSKSNPKEWLWIISKAELTRVSDLLGLGKPEYAQDDIVLETECREIPLADAKQLVIEKVKDKIKLYSR